MKRSEMLPTIFYDVGDLYKKNGVVVGVMISRTTYVSLSDQSSSYTSIDSAKVLASSYSVQGVAGWRIPSKKEWKIMYSNKSIINSALRKAGSVIANDWYWSSSVGNMGYGDGYYCYDYSNGGLWAPGSENRVRLIHDV